MIINHDVKSITELTYSLDSKLLDKIFKAHTLLGRLNGIAKIIPNPDILISFLPLQEAKESSEIENVYTTTEDLFKPEILTDPATKEVQDYRRALELGIQLLEEYNSINLRVIKQIQSTICPDKT